MANEITNLYEELEEELNVGQTDVDIVLKAIDEKIIWYGKKINNPQYKAIVPIKTKALKFLKAQISDNPDVIKQHAAAYAEIARQKQIEREKNIRERGKFFVRDGMIAQQNLTQLANETKLSESEILKLLGAKVKQKRIFTYKDDGIQELESEKMKQIAKQLSILGKKHIYDFLGVSPSSPLEQVSNAVKNKFKWVTGNSNKTDPIVNATDGLIKLCAPIFKDEKSRRSYDKAIENEGFSSVRKAIEMMKFGTKYISPSQYKQLLDTCTQNGITKDKAEYLIYTTAEKAGIDIDEGTVGDMITCRYCGALNEHSTHSCRSCGMPVKVKCPKCGKESADDDYRCTTCGFSLIDMKDARIHITMVRAAISGNSIDDAEKELLLAARFWPNCPEICVLEKEITEKKKSIQGVLGKINELCSKKYYYAAQQYLAVLPSNHAQRKEIESAIENTKILIVKAKSTSNTNEQIDCYMQALSICSDCAAAKEKLQLTPPMAPVNIKAEVKGNIIHIEWSKLQSQYIQYLLIRKANGRPSSPKDGEVICETLNNVVDDSKIESGISYYYAVYSKCGEVLSPQAAITTTPVLTVADINPNSISLDIQETQIGFGFVFPSRAKCIELYRDGTLIKNLTGSSYIDVNLKPDQPYTYKFVTIYEDCSQKRYSSKGVTQVIRPMSPPKPVKLVMTEQGDIVKLSWDKPNKGTLCIYESNKSFDILENNKVNIDNLKQRQLDISGNSYQIRKNFSGVKYFLPITVQGNIGVAGKEVKLVSIIKPSGVSFDRNETFVQVKWKWDNISTVRIQVQVDNGNVVKYDVGSSMLPNYKVDFPKSAKSIRICIASTVLIDGETLVGEDVSQVFSLKSVKVNFKEVKSESILGFLNKDKYSLTLNSESILPCDLQLIISENFAPTNLINYKSFLEIKSAELQPGIPLKKEFQYTRKQKNKPVFFRIIAKNRELANQIVIIPETRELK